MKQTLITSALPYANGYLHLGHCVGAYLPADMYARFLRLAGEKVLYVCGSDEHGAAITISAEKEGVSPQAIIDKYHAEFADVFQKFGMSFDIYSRTSLPVHHETAQEFFLDLFRKNCFADKEENQFYDSAAGRFLPDRYVEGICPNCGSDKARGDQCDKCGAYYNQLELKNPRSLVSGKTPEVRATKHWYFKLGDFQECLEQYIAGHPEWKDNVLQQSQSWLKQGLSDRAITRDLDWGVPVPLENANGKALYVWFEAVLGYISGTKEWARLAGNPDAWKDWWQNPETDYIAFIGKDNIVFHTLIFPAILMAKGGYILPKNVPGNEFLNLEGDKFSKSRNWSIDLRDYLNDFPEPQSADALRYALATAIPETKDSDFTWKDFQARVNNELAAILGNFINRAAQFLHKNFDGKVPVLAEKYQKLPSAWKLLLADLEHDENLNPQSAFDEFFPKYTHYFSVEDLRLVLSQFFGAKIIAEKYRNFRFRDAVQETMNLARAANKYFNDAAPWKSVKDAPEDCAKTLFLCVQTIRSLAIAFSPILPFTSAKMLTMLNAEHLDNSWSTLAQPLLPEGLKTETPVILFAKIENDVIEKQIAKLHERSQKNTVPIPELPAEITIDDFKKIALRTAVIIAAERVPKSEKLMKLQVDTGFDKRQIVAGIGKFYTPEELIGKTVCVVVNLKPAKLMGNESNGMLLAANMADGSLALVAPEKPTPTGAEVR